MITEPRRSRPDVKDTLQTSQFANNRNLFVQISWCYDWCFSMISVLSFQAVPVEKLHCYNYLLSHFTRRKRWKKQPTTIVITGWSRYLFWEGLKFVNFCYMPTDLENTYFTFTLLQFPLVFMRENFLNFKQLLQYLQC